MIDYLLAVDESVNLFINEYITSSFLDYLMPIITCLGNGGFIWGVISLGLIITKKYRKVGIIAFCALLLNYFLGDIILKNIIQRPRPFANIPDLELLIRKPSSYSFPSGHTSSAFTMAFLLNKMFDNKKVVLLIFILAILISFSRVYLQVHYFSDVISGIIMGLISANITYSIYNLKWGDKYDKQRNSSKYV